ncbi:MAG: hypothetical protein M9887_08675 [Chitinophagales bacterium]|nr:hypothetical protein [Chitinophagales bacterium]
MQPRDAEIDMAHGDSRSVRLYLLKSDGTNNIYPGGALDYKVVWETEGIYGQFENNSNNFTTQNNSVVYTAYDDENVTDGSTENITAKIYMKAKSSSSWILLDNVSGQVRLSNDSKRMIIYRSSVGIHKDLDNWCYAGCVMVIPKIKDAIRYQVYSSATGGDGVSWVVTGSEPGLVAGAPGIKEEDVPAGSYLYGDYYSFTWGGPLDPNVPHSGDHNTPPPCGDTYKIVITLKQ